MKTKLDALLNKWNYEEMLYKEYTLTKHDEVAFAAFCSKLDMKVLKNRHIILPGISDFLEYPTLIGDFFHGNIHIAKHDRYNFPFKHRHTFCELIYVYQGKCENIIDGESHVINKGELIILPPNVEHSIYTTGIVINILIKRNFILEAYMTNMSETNALTRFFFSVTYLAKNITNDYIRIDISAYEEIGDLLHLLIWEGLTKSSETDNVRKYMLLAFFAQITRECKGKLSNCSTHKCILQLEENYKALDELMLYVLMQMHKSYRTITLEDVAAMTHYSVPYLSKKISDSVDMTFREILYKIRNEHARELLTNTNMTIDEISNKIGYESPVSFYRAFKQNVGLTPAQYRRSIMENKKFLHL